MRAFAENSGACEENGFPPVIVTCRVALVHAAAHIVSECVHTGNRPLSAVIASSFCLSLLSLTSLSLTVFEACTLSSPSLSHSRSLSISLSLSLSFHLSLSLSLSLPLSLSLTLSLSPSLSLARPPSFATTANILLAQTAGCWCWFIWPQDRSGS